MKENVMKSIRKNIKWIIALMCFLIFNAILVNVLNNKIDYYDTIINSMISFIRSNLLTNFFKVFTILGSAPILITEAVIILIILKNKKIGVFTLVNLILIAFLNQALKQMIQRPRPIANRLIEEGGYSFPSGHSMASMAFYGLVIYFVHQYVQNKTIKNIICILLGIFILLIGISRIYLGVHYISDVLAGFTFSIAYLIGLTAIISKLMNIKEVDK